MAGFLGNQPPKVPLTSADISDGTITNDDLAGSIANSKLATDPTNASNLASGTVPTARLGSGTASSSTFLRGDQTYATAGGGLWTEKASGNIASSTSSLVLTGISKNSKLYLNVNNTTNGAFYKMFSSTDGGTNYSTDYSVEVNATNADGSTTSIMQISGGNGNSSGQGLNIIIEILYPELSNSTIFKHYAGGMYTPSGTSLYQFTGTHACRTAQTTNAIKIEPSAGTFSGRYRLLEWA